MKVPREDAKVKIEWPLGCEGHPASLGLLVFQKIKRVKVSPKTKKLKKTERKAEEQRKSKGIEGVSQAEEVNEQSLRSRAVTEEGCRFYTPQLDQTCVDMFGSR